MAPVQSDDSTPRDGDSVYFVVNGVWKVGVVALKGSRSKDYTHDFHICIDTFKYPFNFTHDAYMGVWSETLEPKKNAWASVPPS